MTPTGRQLSLTEQIKQHTLSPDRTAQLLGDLANIRELLTECLESPSDCKEALICQKIREISLPLCDLSLARVVGLLNANAQCAGERGGGHSNRRLKAYAEVVDDVICYIESIRDGYQSDDGFLENIEEKMSAAGVSSACHIKTCSGNCPSGVMTEFLESVSLSLQEIRLLLSQWKKTPDRKFLATELLRQLHALKGGVLVYGVAGLVESIQSLESCVVAFLKGELKACERMFELLGRYVSRMVTVAGLLGKELLVNSRLLSAVNVAPATHSSGAPPLPHIGKGWQKGGVNALPDSGQPVSQKLPRLRFLVERASIMLGKPVRLLVSGEEVVIPSAVMEKLIAPLELLIWNAIDHGIESPAARAAAGKPGEGVITLSFAADPEGSAVTVTVSDDGAGIDEEAVRQKAIEGGYGASNESVEEMIFYPGLSTAAAVSPVSGRGVGLDVVKTEVSRLDGTVEVQTARGEGSSFTLVVPLNP